MSALTIVSLLLGGLGVAGGLAAGPALAGPACPGVRADRASAMATAVACGKRVEDLSARSPWSQLFANPDGTRESVSFAEPRWARRGDGSWAPVDTGLRRVGEVVAPAATVLPVTLSAGGGGPLATLADGDRRLAVSWPGMLPVPVLAGASATYPGVLPGVDLRVTATAVGFSEVLVVKTRQAAANPALRTLRFGVATRGVSVSAVPGRGLRARDGRGRVVFASPPASMWDSTGAPVADASSSGSALPAAGLPRMAVMAETVRAGQVLVAPDRAFLADPATRYPVFVDPSWAGGPVGGLWKLVVSRSDAVNSSTFALTNGATRGDAGSGRVCDSVSSSGSCLSTPYLVRSLFRMPIGAGVGKHVLRASFNITQKWAWTCTPKSDAKLWLTGAFTSSTAWSTQPSWDATRTVQAAASHRVDANYGCAGTGTVSFDAGGLVLYGLSQGWTDVSLGLRAVDEGTVGQWKRFDHSTASLSITYNSYPNVPDTLSTGGQGCLTGSGRPVVGVSAPTLSARVTDPDGAGEGDIAGSLRGEFAWERLDQSSGVWSAVGSGSGTPQASGTTSPSPAPSFTTGNIYRWHVQAADLWSLPIINASGTDYSAWSQWCEFEVDTVRPNPPTLTPDAANSPFVAGRTVRLSFSPGGTPADSDITGYRWWVVDGAGTHPTTWAAGSTVTVDWTPIAGLGAIHVLAKDRIQDSATDAVYAFNAAQASTEVARWRLNEPAGATILADSTGHGHDATLIAGQLGEPGRIVNGDTCLLVDATSSETVDTGGPVLDTSRSFTVSAWARLSAKTGSQVIAIQKGSQNSPFYLMYQGGYGYDRWDFEAPSADQGQPVWWSASSANPPSVGTWTHLAGVYDAGAHQLRLYVNGVLAGTADGVTTWRSTGHFRIGQSTSGASFGGSIADLRVWDRMLSAGEISAMVDPLSPADGSNVGRWHMDEGSGDVAFDSSDYFHDITLNLDAGVGWTSAGHTGSALAFNGNGMAHTDGPVLYTDQSFTVSAWVQLRGTTGMAQGVVSQGGDYGSSFALEYDEATNKWAMTLASDDSPSRVWFPVRSDAAVQVGVWYHLVGVYDADARQVRFYVGTATSAPVRQSATATGATTFRASGALKVGALGTMAAPDNFFNGYVDEATVYVGGVPEAEIGQLP